MCICGLTKPYPKLRQSSPLLRLDPQSPRLHIHDSVRVPDISVDSPPLLLQERQFQCQIQIHVGYSTGMGRQAGLGVPIDTICAQEYTSVWVNRSTSDCVFVVDEYVCYNYSASRGVYFEDEDPPSHVLGYIPPKVG